MPVSEDGADLTSSAEALRAVRERYALATAAGGVGVWDRDLASGAAYVDPVFAALLGLDPAATGAAALWPGRLHPDDRERVRANERAALAPDAPRDPEGHTPIPEIEYRLRHRDGSARWFLDRGRVLRRADRTPYRLVGTATGITDRKQAEEALRAGEARLRTQYQALPLPTFTWRRVATDFVLIDFNRAAAALAPVPLAPLLGRAAPTCSPTIRRSRT